MTRYLVLIALLLSAAGCAGHPQPLAGDTKVLRDCADACPEMVAIPGGSFLIGSPDSEIGRDTMEGPQKTITIRRFALGRYDVTRAQWAAFVTATHRPVATGCAWAGGKGPALDPDRSWQNVDFAQDDSHPVVCVTWGDAQAYVRWLSARTHHHYRLPTEAEWEYAARAGTTTAFAGGDTLSHEQANYGSDTCCSGLAAGKDVWAGTSPAGAFAPNAFGLYDMQGNVLQWTQDCLSALADKPADGSAYEVATPLAAGGPWSPKMVGLNACAFRMLRGGDWGDPPRMLRSAFRNYGPPKGATIDDYRSGGVGFRVAMSLD